MMKELTPIVGLIEGRNESMPMLYEQFSQLVRQQQLPSEDVDNILGAARWGIDPEVNATQLETSNEATRVKLSGGKQATPDHGFKFGRKSQRELDGVLPEFAKVALVAIAMTTQDFMIFEGPRTIEEQRELLRKGMSRTMQSYHLIRSDGYCRAFDAVPVVGSTPKWDWNLIYPVVLAIDRAATKLGVADRIVWGGAWDRRLSDFGGDIEAYKDEVEQYARRHPGKDFIDGPHFQWMD